MLGKFLKALTSKKPALSEEQSKQYLKSLDEITMHFNGVRVNETLLGKIRAAKMDDCVADTSRKIAVQHSVERPVSFGDNVMEWFSHVRQEAKDIMNKNHAYSEQEKEYAEKLKVAHQEQALAKRREFYIQYGLLPKDLCVK